MNRCIACHSQLIQPFYSAGPQPLMALNLPRTREEAKRGPFYPMDFYMCLECGHVFNINFEYAKIPYVEDSNLMYNGGSGWKDHILRMANLLIHDYDALGTTIVDIGAGDGEFLKIIQQRSHFVGRTTRCVAFEPGIESETCKKEGIETYVDYFLPERDMGRIKPAIVVCRHVLEHMANPCDFIAEIAYYAESPVLFFAEVPCITKALKTHRITDFLYEHVSNFTQESLDLMFKRSGWTVSKRLLTYHEEVAIWIGYIKRKPHWFANTKKQFQDHTWDAVANIREGLAARRKAGKKIAFWGGAGKGAAFLNAYNITGDRVVDSDENKVGRHVPGTGQLIEHSGNLKVDPVDTIIITTRWRAADIYEEIRREHIYFNEVLVLEGAKLIKYQGGEYA